MPPAPVAQPEPTVDQKAKKKKTAPKIESKPEPVKPKEESKVASKKRVVEASAPQEEAKEPAQLSSLIGNADVPPD